MSDASHSDLVEKFTGVTGVDDDRAKFYLESAGWQLDVALGSFYENDDEGDSSMGPTGDPLPSAQQPASDASAPTRPTSQQQSRFGTIAGLSSQEPDNDSEEEGEAFYAGGSEHGGGQQVLGPPKKKKQSADEFVQNMFKSAKEHGAEEVSPGGSSGDRPVAKPSFRGTGYRLGDTAESSNDDIIHGVPIRDGRRQIDVVLKLWKNGFCIDSGQLRDYTAPESKEFLTSIRNGEVPKELIRMARGEKVNLSMEDHRTEDFEAPKVKVKAFTGQGHMLGSPAPTALASVVIGADGASSGASGEDDATKQLAVDASQPTTQLQIRLKDGSRMVSTFNHSHTVSQVREYINAAQPQFSGLSYVLMTTFPNKELSDESVTLKAANLLNAVLVQRAK